MLPDTQEPPPAPPGRRFAALRDPALLRMAGLGFSSGLPLVLIYGTLSYRLREAGVDRSTIGFLSAIALLFALKFAWAPAVDRIAVPWLTARVGRRRAWLLFSQALVLAGLLAMASFDARTQLTSLALTALFTAFAAATQDIALDGYRIESAPPARQAALAAVYQVGYRVAMLWAGAGALGIAQWAAGGQAGYVAAAWRVAYMAMAASMLVGAACTLVSPPVAADRDAPPPRRLPSLSELAEPLRELFARFGGRALLLLLLIATWRLPSIVMGVMANPFYQDIGFTKGQVAEVSKVYGLLMLLAGGLAGAAWMPRVGLARMMALAATVSAASILLYALIAVRGPDLHLLVAAVSVDNFAGGVAGTVFISYLSGLVREGFSASQYALLSSCELLLPKLVGVFSGVAVDHAGYAVLFVACSASGVVTLVALALVVRYVPDPRFSKR